jgi:phosphoinositide-3-kinase, regulatory subunit 4
LCAVRDSHAQNVYHGDIKTENCLVTSWNWLYLSDYSSSFKPTYLPEDNPAEFSFYFDTSGRRTCYVAPERFLSAGAKPDGNNKINWAMDIFSVGCVIAELFLEAPIFTLSQTFKYKRGEYDPEVAHLNKIQDPDMRELIAHMIQLDPETRYAADEYLNFWRRKTFPDYFYTFLHQYMYTITDPSSGQKPVTAGFENLGESDERIEKIYNDFDKIAYFLSNDGDGENSRIETNQTRSTNILPFAQIDIPNYKNYTLSKSKSIDDGTLIFLSVVASSLRSTARATARIKACDLLLAFSEHATDEAKLDRVLPYVILLLNDKLSDLVKVAAIRTITQLVNLPLSI